MGNIGNAEMRELGMLDQLKICLCNSEYVLTGIGTSGIIIYFYLFTTVVG